MIRRLLLLTLLLVPASAGQDELHEVRYAPAAGTRLAKRWTAEHTLTLPFGHLTEEAWAKSLDTNLRGPVFLVERALPHLEASGNAAILNVISAGAFLFASNTAMYSAGKAGLMAMTRAIAPPKTLITAKNQNPANRSSYQSSGFAQGAP